MLKRQSLGSRPAQRLARFAARDLLGAILLSLVTATMVVGQEPDQPFQAEQQVTAVDIVAEYLPGPMADPTKNLPNELEIADFEILFDGEPLPLISIERPDAPAAEPWTFVLYFDLQLASPATVTWAATALSSQVATLSRLGVVEIVAANPDAHRLLSPTRDPELIGGVLAQLALEPSSESSVVELREAFLAASHVGVDSDRVELAQLARDQEHSLIRQRLDTLLGFLTASSAVQAPLVHGRRALFLISDGFDPRPDEFYRQHGLEAPSSAIDNQRAAMPFDLQALAQTLAAYGWVTFPLTPPSDAPLVAARRIGKWVLGKPNTTYEERDDPQQPGKKLGVALFNLLSFRRQDRYDPERAEAYVELAEAHFTRGDLNAAEDAYERALYHFADDLRSADKQARAYARLGELRGRLGDEEGAREALIQAERRDPKSLPGDAPPLPILLDRRAPLDVLARETTGTVIQGQPTLADVLTRFDRRARFTYQLPGRVDGALHRVELRCRDQQRCRWNAPGWARMATLETVAETRLRGMLWADELIDGELQIDAAWQLADDDEPCCHDRYPLEASFEPIVEAASDASWQGQVRVSLAWVGEDVPIVMQHSVITAHLSGSATRWTYRDELSVPSPGPELLLVMLEHLESGRWGVAFVEVP